MTPRTTLSPLALAALFAGCQTLAEGVQVDTPVRNADVQRSAPAVAPVDAPPGTPRPSPPMPPSPLTVDALHALTQAALRDWTHDVPCVGDFPAPAPDLNCHLTRHLGALPGPRPHLAFMINELGRWGFGSTSDFLPAPLVDFSLVDAGGRREPDSAAAWEYFRVALGIAADGSSGIEIHERTSDDWLDVTTGPFEIPAGIHEAARYFRALHQVRSGQATHALPLDRSSFLAVEVLATGSGEAARIEAAAARHLAIAQKCHRAGPVATQPFGLRFQVSPAGRLTASEADGPAPGRLKTCLARGLGQVRLSPADAGSTVSFFFFVRPAARLEVKVVGVATGGDLLQAEAEAALAAPVAAAQSCYQAAAERHPRLEGLATMRLVVGAGGEVEMAQFDGSHLKPVSTCVEAVFRATRFPARAGSSRVAASLAFHNSATSSMDVAKKSL